MEGMWKVLRGRTNTDKFIWKQQVGNDDIFLQAKREEIVRLSPLLVSHKFAVMYSIDFFFASLRLHLALSRKYEKRFHNSAVGCGYKTRLCRTACAFSHENPDISCESGCLSGIATEQARDTSGRLRLHVRAPQTATHVGSANDPGVLLVLTCVTRKTLLVGIYFRCRIYAIEIPPLTFSHDHL